MSAVQPAMTKQTRFYYLVCFAVVSALISLMTVLGLFRAIDTSMTDMRARILRHEPTNEAVIVAIDTKSLQEFRTWPWSRSVHGRLVTALSDMGVASISFDIDFSTSSTDRGDADFAAAIKQSPVPVYMATFRQALSSDLPDVYAEMWPNPDLKAVGQPVSVNYVPEATGMLRVFYDQTRFSDGPLVSMPAAVAGETVQTRPRLLNYATNVRNIRQVSYTDVLNNAGLGTSLRGKHIFVGATAVELGDEYVMPIYGVQSGVLLNVLAYENIASGTSLRALPWHIGSVLAALSLIGCIALNLRYARHRWIGYIGLGTLMVVGSVLFQAALFVVLPISASLAVLLLWACCDVWSELEKRQRQAFLGKMAARDQQLIIQSLISENHEGIIALNRYGEVDMVNARAGKLLELTGLSEGDKLAELAPDFCRSFDLDTSVEKQIGQGEYSYYTGAGELVAIDVTVSRLKIDPLVSRFEQRTEARLVTIIAMHDVSAQKRAAEAEREAKEIYAAMSEAKSQLISTITHELRTPLNSIIGFSDIIKDEMFGPAGAGEYVEYSEMINSSGRQLLSVINGMLIAARLQSNEMEPVKSSNDVSLLFESSLDESRKRMSWKDQHLDILHADGNVLLNIDPQLFQAALVQLLDNAAKFGGEDGTIRIRTGYVDGGYEMSITDTGPGCRPDLLSGLTQMFQQADGSLQRNYEGCGLGLYIAREIVELHGGKLTLISAPDSGFTARIRLASAGQSSQSSAQA